MDPKFSSLPPLQNFHRVADGKHVSVAGRHYPSQHSSKCVMKLTSNSHQSRVLINILKISLASLRKKKKKKKRYTFPTISPVFQQSPPQASEEIFKNTRYCALSIRWQLTEEPFSPENVPCTSSPTFASSGNLIGFWRGNTNFFAPRPTLLR